MILIKYCVNMERQPNTRSSIHAYGTWESLSGSTEASIGALVSAQITFPAPVFPLHHKKKQH